MNELLIVLRILYRHKFKLIACIAFIMFCFYLSGGEQLEFVSLSPDKGYRMEHYSPRRYQILLHPTMNSPGFVRLYNNYTNRYFGESQVADFSAGDAAPLWQMDKGGEVSVGLYITYENVPPLSPSGKELPIRPFSFSE